MEESISLLPKSRNCDSFIVTVPNNADCFDAPQASGFPKGWQHPGGHLGTGIQDTVLLLGSMEDSLSLLASSPAMWPLVTLDRRKAQYIEGSRELSWHCQLGSDASLSEASVNELDSALHLMCSTLWLKFGEFLFHWGQCFILGESTLPGPPNGCDRH